VLCRYGASAPPAQIQVSSGLAQHTACCIDVLQMVFANNSYSNFGVSCPRIRSRQAGPGCMQWSSCCPYSFLPSPIKLPQRPHVDVFMDFNSDILAASSG
jgi:hypothetical protein